MKKTAIIGMILGFATVLSAAEKTSFLKDFNIGTEGIYRVDLSEGNQSWGAALVTGFQLNKYVGVNIRTIANEGDNWGGNVIDENHINATFNLLKSANGKLSLNGEAGYARSWGADDNGINIGGNLKYSLTQNLSASAGALYQVWNKQGNSLLIPFGLGYSF